MLQVRALPLEPILKNSDRHVKESDGHVTEQQNPALILLSIIKHLALLIFVAQEYFYYE